MVPGSPGRRGRSRAINHPRAGVAARHAVGGALSTGGRRRTTPGGGGRSVDRRSPHCFRRRHESVVGKHRSVRRRCDMIFLDLRDLSVYRPTTGARSRTSARFRIRKRPPILAHRRGTAAFCTEPPARFSAFDTHPHPLHSCYIPPGGLASAPLPATQRPAPSLWPSSGVGRAFSQRRALSYFLSVWA